MNITDKAILFDSEEELKTFKSEMTKGMLAIDTMKNLEAYFTNKALLTKRAFHKLVKNASDSLMKQVKKGSVIRHREKR